MRTLLTLDEIEAHKQTKEQRMYQINVFSHSSIRISGINHRSETSDGFCNRPAPSAYQRLWRMDLHHQPICRVSFVVVMTPLRRSPSLISLPHAPKPLKLFQQQPDRLDVSKASIFHMDEVFFLVFVS